VEPARTRRRRSALGPHGEGGVEIERSRVRDGPGLPRPADHDGRLAAGGHGHPRTRARAADVDGEDRLVARAVAGHGEGAVGRLRHRRRVSDLDGDLERFVVALEAQAGRRYRLDAARLGLIGHPEHGFVATHLALADAGAVANGRDQRVGHGGAERRVLGDDGADAGFELREPLAQVRHVDDRLARDGVRAGEIPHPVPATGVRVGGRSRRRRESGDQGEEQRGIAAGSRWERGQARSNGSHVFPSFLEHAAKLAAPSSSGKRTFYPGEAARYG
jgi:hypothetical protein